MSIKAKARMAAAEAAAEAQREAEWQAEQARIAEEQRPIYEAGPENGCRECYVWGLNWIGLGHMWQHGQRAVKPGPQPPPPPDVPWLYGDDDESHWCWHECHGNEAPVYCGPVAMAAC